MSSAKENFANGVSIDPETLGPSLESIPVPESFQPRFSGTGSIKSTELNNDKERTNEKNRKNGSRSRTPSSETWDRRNRVSLLQYLYIELTRGYWLEHDQARFMERRKRVYAFIHIPIEIEKFITYGFFQCVDVFLFIFTFLPLRFLRAVFKFCFRGCLTSCFSQSDRVLDPAEICDLLKAIVLVSCCFLMNYIDVSMMYHVIRGQTVIKLYIFYNMLDIADKLCASFGQDILDSLFWTATEPRGKRREHFGVIPHLLLAIVYVFFHTILVLFQANTLNVAFNSHNKALLTIMMSNNFVELKASVFKKFEKNNLFQMSCSDVRERFHLMILLTIVGVRNLTEFSWNMDHFWVLIPDIMLVMFFEFAVDWVKHAFITKFNEIPSEVYKEYTVSIAYDMASSRHTNAFSDHLDMVSRRMGFIPLPLAVLLVRVVVHSIRLKGSFSYLLLLLFYLCLVTFKVLNSIILLGKAYDLIEENKQTASSKAETKQVPSMPLLPTSKDDLELLAMPKVSSMELSNDQMLRRSQSLVDLATEKEPMPEPTPDVDLDSTAYLRSSSFATNSLLYNSMVSLQSVGLNDEFIEDTQEGEPVVLSSSSSGSLRHRETPSKDKKADNTETQPLSEVDRYTMVCNRII